jgi:hypothetical protein
MITINVTLIVQIIHFFIAYLLISRLVLKPGLVLVRQEQHEKKQALQRVTVEQERIAQKQEAKRQRWQLCQDYFNEHKPSQVSFVPTRMGEIKQVQPDVFTEQEIRELASIVVSALEPVKSRASHD